MPKTFHNKSSSVRHWREVSSFVARRFTQIQTKLTVEELLCQCFVLVDMTLNLSRGASERRFPVFNQLLLSYFTVNEG